MEKATKSERKQIRDFFYGSPQSSLCLGRRPDGETWFADIYGITYEAGTCAELFRILADILEES